MRKLEMPWFFIICLLTLNNLSEARHQKKLPTAVVVGTVYCDTCFQQDFSKSSHFISGASVAVECKDENSRPSFHQEVKTDEHGEFKVHLPFSVSKHERQIKGCSVKLLSSSEPYCAVASTATSSSLHLKSRKEGTHIFSAGFFTFKPERQPTLCNEKPSIQNSKEFNTKKVSQPAIPSFDDPSFPPPLQDPTMPNLPPVSPIPLPPVPLLPMLPPLPQLPPLPPLPGVPNFPPFPGKSTQTKGTESSKTAQLQDKKAAQTDQLGFPLPPVPGLTPPIIPPVPGLTPPIIPPVPGLTPPTAPIIPPVPGLTPPSSPFIPLPPIPGLVPPPTPTPSFPVPVPSLPPLPPVPTLPLPPLPPSFPGIPPASSSSSSQQKSP